MAAERPPACSIRVEDGWFVLKWFASEEQFGAILRSFLDSFPTKEDSLHRATACRGCGTRIDPQTRGCDACRTARARVNDPWIVVATIILESRPEHDHPLAMEPAKPTKTRTRKKEATRDE